MFRLKKRMRRSNPRSETGVSEISQFIPSMYILFLLVFFPVLNIAALFVAAATQYLATNDFVAKAATQPNYSTALNTMASEAYQFQSYGLSKFLGMTPEGGYTGCGDDLYVVTTEIASGTLSKSLANQPITTVVDTNANMYELSVRSAYSFSPLIDMSAMPVLGSVPGLGQPVVLAFTANRPVEHAGGLRSNVNNGGGSGSAPVLPFDRAGIATTANTDPTPDTWRDPGIFKKIQDAGRTVVSVNVIVVPARSQDWIPTGLTVSLGQQIWVDTQAVGKWSMGNGSICDANGLYGWTGGPNAPNEPCGALLGRVGNARGSAFLLGNEKFDLPLTGSGGLSLIVNDSDYRDNSGFQYVRIIVTQ